MIMNVVKYTLDIALTFSIFVLLCVSIERLVAARRPHAFTFNAHRAKLALRCGGCDYMSNSDVCSNESYCYV